MWWLVIILLLSLSIWEKRTCLETKRGSKPIKQIQVYSSHPVLLKWTWPVQATSIQERRNRRLNLQHEKIKKFTQCKANQNTNSQVTWIAVEGKGYLFKLHNRLRSAGRVQRKNVKRCINLRLFLDISSSRNNLNPQKSLLSISPPSYGYWRKLARQATFSKRWKWKALYI